MNIASSIATVLQNLQANPAEVDLSEIKALLSAAHEALSKGAISGALDSTKATQQQAERIQQQAERIAELEASVSAFKVLLTDLKCKAAGKVNLVYKDSSLKTSLLESLNSDSLPLESFLKLQEQVEYEFNSAWFPEKRQLPILKQNPLNTSLYKTGGIK